MSRRFYVLSIPALLLMGAAVTTLPAASPQNERGSIRQVAGFNAAKSRRERTSGNVSHGERSDSGFSGTLRSLGRFITGESAASPVPTAPPRHTQTTEDWSHLSHPVDRTKTWWHDKSGSAAAPQNSGMQAHSRSAAGDEGIVLPEPPVEQELPVIEQRAEPEEVQPTLSPSGSSRRSGRREVRSFAPTPGEEARSSQPATTVPKVARRPLPARSEPVPSIGAQENTPEPVPAKELAPAPTAPAQAQPSSPAAAVPNPSGNAGEWSAAARSNSQPKAEPNASQQPEKELDNAAAPRETAPQAESKPNYSQPQAPRRNVASPAPRKSIPAQPSRTIAPRTGSNNEVTMEVPAVRVMMSGPREVTVAKTSPYEIVVENRGAIDLKGLVVRASIPSWIKLHGHRASHGEAQAQANQGGKIMLWQVSQLAAGSSERMLLQLAPEEAKPFDIQIEWTLMPVTSITSVAVQEPKLELRIEGPDQVTFGDTKVYNVRVLNPGSGTAEGVVFTLSPNSATPQRQKLGDIPAGKEAQFEVELMAQDGANLEIHGLVTAAAGLRDESVKTIAVAAARLAATLNGPPLQYQDSEAAYQLTLSNDGEATTEKVEAEIKLPPGVEYVAGIEGARVEGDAVRWTVDRLAPEESASYEFLCRMKSTGNHHLAFNAKGSANGKASVSLTTQVEAIADLVLTIQDPQAPAPVGEEVVYEMIIRNRGSKAATDVKAVAQFSYGIEPKSAGGHAHELVPGQVLFEDLPRVEAGAEVRLKVVAKATDAGVHRFRAEVRSGETVLISEEATRYITLSGSRVSSASSDTSAR